jgi:hypothetical protein
MMNWYKGIGLALFVLLFFIGSVSAMDADGIGNNQTLEDGSLEMDLSQNQPEQEVIEESQEVVVDNWDDLQYYCSLDDQDYVLRLKENTNYYPTDASDSSYQIVVNNNVKIIGNEGAYFGDTSSNPRNITYTAIKVNDNSGKGIFLQNVNFKWISTYYQPDGVFLQMAGNADNAIENCYFNDISTNMGHSSIIHIKIGHVSLTNCTFVNCTTDFGCLSVYNPNDDPTGTCTGASMEVSDCYFEGNYARTEPGCINNCGVLVVSNTTFYKNSAFWWAGAIHTHGGANTTIYDCDFIDNVAGWNGGALYTYSYLQIYRSRFIGNNCTTNNGGGAIGACKYLHAPHIYIEDSLFEDNENLCWGLSDLSTSGTGRGGAISFMDEGSLEVYNNTFIRNSASIGTAICAISGGLSHGSPDVCIVGNRFIDHTRIGDVLDVRVATGSVAEIRDNYFSNNSIVFSKLKLEAEDPASNGDVTFHIDVALKNPNSYDSDILDKSKYDVYVDGVYTASVPDRDFTLNLGKGNTAYVYVVPSISNSRSNEVFAGIAKTFIYVSQNSGSDENNGSTRTSPVKTLARAIELANVTENIVIMDGTFSETGLTINYNLTILAENNAAITVTGNAFKITDGDVKFQNLTFKNSKYGSSTKNRLILQENTGFLIFEGCIFQGNEYKTHIEASGMVEGENLIFNNNKDGSVIRCNSISLKSSIFTNNVATYTLYKSLLMYNTQTVKFEIENLTFTGNTVNSGCIGVKKGSGTITDCTFTGNSVSSSGKGSAIFIEDGSSLVVRSSKFISNTDKGKDSSVIYISSGSLLIEDSILINNHYENDNHVIINGLEASLKKLIANNNWWGNTVDNLNKPALKVFEPSNTLPGGWDPAQYWLVLNVTSISDELELNKAVPVQFAFTQIDNNGNVTYYDGYNLPSFDLDLTAVNGTCPDSKITVENGIGTAYFILTQKSTSSLTGSFNGISTTINFGFSLSIPEMTIETKDISVGDAANITVHFQQGVTGEVILKVANITEYGTISDSKVTFIIPDIPAGNYTVEVNYTGDDRYDTLIKNATLVVNKHNSTTHLSVGAIELNKDVVLTISLSDGATGNVDVYVNGIKETIEVGQSYTIKNIPRGNYAIKAVYTGDGYYLASEDECKFEVGKLTPTLSINVSDIVYGDDTVVNVTLENDATGIVNVFIDGKNATGTLIDGKTNVIIQNVNVGNDKLVNVLYYGDNNYKNASANTTYNVGKANINFTISSNNVKVGQAAVVEIRLPARAGGTVTISGIKSEVKNVPASGLVILTYDDLGIGTYTVFAEYNGNNYNTISKSTTFNVSDWNDPQWANDAGNVKHTGKSPYDSDVNGEIKWVSSADQITGNLAIDSEGNVYVTTANGVYSFSPDGDLRWTFISTSAGTSFSGISISRDVVISPKADDTLFFINQSTGERYGHANLYLGSSYFSPVVDSNGNVYISGQGGEGNNPNLVIIPYKIWENGGNPTVIALGSAPVASPTIIDDNLVCVPCENGLKIVDVSSKQLTSIKSGSIAKGTSVVGEGNIIYSFLGDSIVALFSSGEEIWTRKVTGGVGDKLFVDSEQGLYSVNAKGELYRYDLMAGSESKFTDFNVTSGILIGDDSNIYFASDEAFYALDCEGNVLWKANLGDKIIGTPIMDENGIIYANSLDKVYALKNAELKDANLSVSTQTIDVGSVEEIIITLNENATGFVEIDIDGNVSQVNVVDGKVIKTISDLALGNYNVSVYYLGDLRYGQSLKLSNFSVLKANPIIQVDVDNITYGEDAVFDIVLPANAEGTVTVQVDGKFNSSILAGGVAKIIINGLSSGIKVATVEYSGDDNYLAGNVSCSLYVSKLNSSVYVSIDDIDYGSAVIVNVALPEDAGGSVKLMIGDYIDNKTASSIVTFSVPNLNAGEYAATVVYSGDVKYNGNSTDYAFKVNKVKPVIDILVNHEIGYGDNVSMTISIPNANGNISVFLDSGKLYNGSINETITIPLGDLSLGDHLIKVNYSCDDNYFDNSVNTTVTVKLNVPEENKESSVVVPQDSSSAEFTISLPSDATGDFIVYVDGVPYSKKLSNGAATIKVANLEAGNHVIYTEYTGDNTYCGFTTSNKTVSISSNSGGHQPSSESKPGVTVVDNSPVTPTKAATKITAKKKTFKAKTKVKKYTITLKANGKPVKSVQVTLKIKGKIYKAKTNAKGKATFKIKKLTKKGKYTAVVTFKGNSVYQPSSKKVKITIK